MGTHNVCFKQKLEKDRLGFFFFVVVVFFHLKITIITAVKNRSILQRHVILMPDDRFSYRYMTISVLIEVLQQIRI